MREQGEKITIAISDQDQKISSALSKQGERISELSEAFQSLEREVRDLKQSESFSEPAVIASDDGVLRTTLAAKLGPTLIAGRTVSGASTYDGIFPGPTLKVRPGDRIQLTFESQITTVTNIYFHGLHVSPESNSNNIFVEVGPGDAFTYFVQIPIDHPTGLYWYHPLRYGQTNAQVYAGLSGLILIEGGHDALPETKGIKQRIMALKNIQLDENNSVVAVDKVDTTKQLYTINGQLNPTLLIQPGETQLWRVANIGNDPWYTLELEGHHMYVVAQDGVTLSETTAKARIVLPPGSRVEFIVRGEPAGIYQFRTLGYDTGRKTFPQRVLATLVSQGETGRFDPLPGELVKHDDLRDTDVDNQREIRITQDAQRFMFDGKEFDPERVDQLVDLDAVEEWVIHNDTVEDLTFHIHVNDVQLTHVNEQAVKPAVLQDIIVIPAKGSVTIRIRFTDFLGKFVFHSQNLSQLDHGMMGIVETTQVHEQRRGESVR